MLLAAAAFNIVPDPTFSALMVLPFAVTAIGLHLLLFKPYLAYLEARESATDGARAEARSLDAKAEEALTELEARLATAREEAAAVRASTRDAALKREAEQLQAARDQAAATLDEALEELTREHEAARAEVKEMAIALSSDLADQVLGRSAAA